MAITKLDDDKSNNKYNEVIDVSSDDTSMIFLKKLVEKVDEAIDLANTHITKMAANDAKTGISTAQANAITANTAKTGITTQQAKDISDNKTAVSDNRSEVKNLSGLITTNTNDIKNQGNIQNLLITNKLEVVPDVNSSNNQRLVCGVTQSKGSYSLSFTFSDTDKTGKKITKTGSIQLK
tara:strand:- start:49 stop:588 length:540 start_codon:yes stop_codon:yes gene_type:complete